MEQDSSWKQFYARLEDMIVFAGRGRTPVSPFLTPAERRSANDFLTRRGLSGRFFFWGGYPTAERVRLTILPEYFPTPDPLPLPDPGALPAGFDPAFDPFDPDPAILVPELPDADGGTVALAVNGSGYRTLTHRDYLGSLLATGLERDSVGDIVPLSTCSAAVFCLPGPAALLSGTDLRIGSDAVTVAPFVPPEGFAPTRSFAPVSDTVASARLDCAVAALANLSREEAQERVRSGTVEVDFLPELRPDRLLIPPLILSIRTVGRFRLLSFTPTRKDRLRLAALKYV